jgi:hypothetical protein
VDAGIGHGKGLAGGAHGQQDTGPQGKYQTFYQTLPAMRRRKYAVNIDIRRAGTFFEV